MFDTYLVNLKKFFSDNLTGIDKFIEGEYPDLDIYKDKTVFYFLTPDFEFLPLDSESREMRNSIEVYIIFQKDTIANLKAKQITYMNSVYSLIKENPSMNGIIDYSMITNIKIYEGVESSINARGIYFQIDVVKEF